MSALMQLVDDAIVVWDASGRVVAVNDAASRLYGRAASELVGHGIDRLALPGGEVEAEVALRAALLGHPATAIGRRRCGDDTLAVHTSAAPIRDRGGAIIGAVTIDRPQPAPGQGDAMHLRTLIAHADRERTHPEGAAATDAEIAAPLVVFTQDAELRYTWIHCPVGGWQLDRVLGRTDAELLGEAGNALMELKRQVLASGRGIRAEVPLAIGGRELWYDAVYEPVHEGGRVIGISGLVMNITGRKDAERAARSMERRFQRLADLGLAGMVIGAADGSILWCNAEYARIVGHPGVHGDRPPLRWDDITPPEWLEADRRAWSQMEADGRSQPYEKEYVRPDGSRVQVLISVGLLDRAHAIALVVDVADRHRVERDLLAAHAQLMQANEELDRFAATAAHDLQAPLRKASSFLDLLRMRAGPRLEAAHVRCIEQAADGIVRMHHLVERLLAYGRSGSGARADVAVALDEAVDEALDNLAADIERTRAVVERRPLPQVLFMHLHLVQIMQNLIGNALTYHGGRPPQVEVAATIAGTMVQVDVRDHGPGIPEHLHERIFQPFVRGTSDGHGSGLGLATCRRLVEARGGRIWARSDGRGAVFSFTLPAAPAALAG